MRRLTVLATLALVVLALAGCATMTVSYHRAPGVTFEKYMTYQWGPPDNLPVGDPRLDNNPFFRDYLQGAFEKAMAGKGYVYAATDPDLLLHYHASVSQKIDVYQTDKQYGYCYGNCEPQYVDYELGTIMLDIVDARTDKVVWRGWAQDAINGIIDDQPLLEKRVEKSVNKMMAYLPWSGVLGKYQKPTS